MPETQSWNNVLKKGHFANLLDKYVDVERQWRDDMKLHEGSREALKARSSLLGGL
jgi:hypothetical protein